MIKVIIFDNNGVLAACDSDFTIPKLAEYFGMASEPFKRDFNDIVVPADYGRETTEDFFKRLCKKLGKDCNMDEIWQIFSQCYPSKSGMQELVKSLKTKYQVALLTNFVDAFDYFNQNTWLYKGLFDDDKMFVSSKLGMAKPDEDIFKYVIGKLGVRPDELLFIDDKQENIDAAWKLGIRGIVFKNLDQLKSDLEKTVY